MSRTAIPRPRAKLIEHLQDLGLHRDVERRGRLVGDQDLGLGGQCDRDHDPLAHAAAQLVRDRRLQPRDRIGDAHLLQQAQRPLARLRCGNLKVGPDALGDLVADGEDRVEAGHRVLEDHADPAAADSPQRFALSASTSVVAQADPAARFDPAGRRHQLKQRQAGEALAAPGLANQRQGLPALEREADPVHRVHTGCRHRRE